MQNRVIVKFGDNHPICENNEYIQNIRTKKEKQKLNYKILLNIQSNKYFPEYKAIIIFSEL